MRRVLVLLNARAGTLIDSGAERIRDALAAALGSHVERLAIEVLKPKAMLGAIARTAKGEHDTIVVGGGDGSASFAAGVLAGSDKLLGVLPLGTINLLARDLGMPADPFAAIEALAAARPRPIDLATLNERPFHTLSGIGFFSQMARAREEVRGHPLGRLIGVGLAALRALRRSGGFTLDVQVDGNVRRVEALAVLVTNNRFNPEWRRPRLDAGLLELHLVETTGALGRLKASADLLTGAWRDNDGIHSLVAQSLSIGHVRRRAWAATDGELRREPLPLVYGLRPRALTVLDANAGA